MGRGGGKGGKGKGRTPKFDLYGTEKMKRGKSGAKGAKKKGKTEAEKMKDRKTTAKTHTSGGRGPSSGRLAGRSKPGDVNADAAKANFRDYQQARFPGL